MLSYLSISIGVAVTGVAEEMPILKGHLLVQRNPVTSAFSILKAFLCFSLVFLKDLESPELPLQFAFEQSWSKGSLQLEPHEIRCRKKDQIIKWRRK